jgi:hypothetical protein
MTNIGFAGLVVSALLQPPSWSGTWTSNGTHVSVVRNVHITPHGWDQTADNLTRSTSYGIWIEATNTSIAIDFPRGAGNILTVPRCVIGGEPQTIVVNHGDWWTKTVVSARWVGQHLELFSVTSTGWWKDDTPDVAKPKPTDFKKRMRIVAGQTVDDLSIRVELGDEKGELEYVQDFRRQR